MKTMRTLLLAGALAAMATTASAQAELRAAKVGAKDIATADAMAKFYNKLFGLQTIERRTRANDPTWVEIIMGFGATPAAAKANPIAHVTIVVTPGMPAAETDPVPHLVFNVPDDNATVAMTIANGGKVQRAVQASTSGSNAFLWDPGGNRVEIVTPRK